jgi:hypothetical protein
MEVALLFKLSQYCGLWVLVVVNEATRKSVTALNQEEEEKNNNQKMIKNNEKMIKMIKNEKMIIK